MEVSEYAENEKRNPFRVPLHGVCRSVGGHYLITATEPASEWEFPLASRKVATQT